jgi:hypothetical protein
MSDTLPWNLDLSAACDGSTVVSDYDGASGRLQVTLTNRSGTVAAPRDVRLTATLDLAADDGWAWLQGRTSQNEALVRVFGDIPEDDYAGNYVRNSESGRSYISEEVIALTLPSQASPSFLAGSLRMDRFSLDIEITVDEDEDSVTGMALVFGLDGVELAPGESLVLPPVLIIDGRDPQAMIERYADEVAEEMRARVPERGPTGWRRHDGMAGEVSETAVVARLEELTRPHFPRESFEVPDGYQKLAGDWLAPNEKFPSGMTAFAERIRGAGYRPGLWLAPFLLHQDSAALREHPEMALRSRTGATLLVEAGIGRCAVLDCTHSASEAWLRAVINTIVQEWGYEQLRLGALDSALQVASEVAYSAAGTTGLANLRRGLEIVREAAGEETLILGGDCAFGPAIGLVDAMQVGPDVRSVWTDGLNPSVKRAAAIVLQRNWMHGRWWANDPGCLVSGLNDAETRFFATSIVLSGGTVSWATKNAFVQALVPPEGVSARAIDGGDGPVPSEWRVELAEGRSLIGILNWEEESRWVVVAEYLRPGEVAFDAWNGRILGKGDVLVRPHEASLWQVAGPGQSPRVIGDTGHLNYEELFRRQVSGRVQVRNDGDRPRTVGIEARGRLFEVSLEPGEMQWFD